MSNRNPSNQNKTAQDYLENAQVFLESLEGMLLSLFVSYDQLDLSDEKAGSVISICEMLANGALEDIESASEKTKFDLSKFINRANGITILLSELSRFNLAKGYTASAIHGLFLIANELSKSLETAVDAVMEERNHNSKLSEQLKGGTQ